MKLPNILKKIKTKIEERKTQIRSKINKEKLKEKTKILCTE